MASYPASAFCDDFFFADLSAPITGQGPVPPAAINPLPPAPDAIFQTAPGSFRGLPHGSGYVLTPTARSTHAAYAASPARFSPLKPAINRPLLSSASPLQTSCGNKLNKLNATVPLLPPTSSSLKPPNATTDSLRKKPFMSSFRDVKSQHSLKHHCLAAGPTLIATASDSSLNQLTAPADKENGLPDVCAGHRTIQLDLQNPYRPLASANANGKRSLTDSSSNYNGSTNRTAKKPRLASPGASVSVPITSNLDLCSIDYSTPAAAVAADLPTLFDDGSKPCHSYAQLIGMAILRSENRRLTLSQIYKWISDHFSFYNLNESGWQNSIRHNLSLHKSFVKIERAKDDPGKGNYWCVEPGNETQFLKEKPTRKSSSAAENLPVMSTRLEISHVARSAAFLPATSTLPATPSSAIISNTAAAVATAVATATATTNLESMQSHDEPAKAETAVQPTLDRYPAPQNSHIDLGRKNAQAQSRTQTGPRSRAQSSGSSAPVGFTLPSLTNSTATVSEAHQLFVFPPHLPSTNPLPYTTSSQQHAYLPPLPASNGDPLASLDLSSDATIPVSDAPGPVDDILDRLPDPTDATLNSSLFSPIIPTAASVMYSSPPMTRHYHSQSHGDTSPLKSAAQMSHVSSPVSRMQMKRKYRSMDDSGYISSLESSVLRPNQKAVLLASESDRPRIKRGRAEEEIARLRASSHDSPTGGRTSWACLNVSSSSPLRPGPLRSPAPFTVQMPPPLTPAVKFRPPPCAPPSVSPNTNLRIHRDRVQRMLQSPLRRMSASGDDLTWSSVFNSGYDDTGCGYGDSQLHELNGGEDEIGSFTIFQDMDDGLYGSMHSLANTPCRPGNGSPIKGSIKRPRLDRSQSAGALSGMTNMSAGTASAGLGSLKQVNKTSLLGSPIRQQYQLGSPYSPRNPPHMHSPVQLPSPIRGLSTTRMPTLIEESVEGDAPFGFDPTDFLTEDITSIVDHGSLDILQGFEKIGAGVPVSNLGNAQSHAPSSLRPTRPCGKLGLSWSYSTNL